MEEDQHEPVETNVAEELDRFQTQPLQEDAPLVAGDIRTSEINQFERKKSLLKPPPTRTAKPAAKTKKIQEKKKTEE